MVNIQEKYNLNHIYDIVANPTTLDIGLTPAQQIALFGYVELELFDKSLALASDLKKLPILRSLHGNIVPFANIGSALTASGLLNFLVIVELWEGDVSNVGNAEKKIISFSAFMSNDTGVVTIMDLEPIVWPFQGGYLLPNKVTMSIKVQGNGNIAGAAITPGILATWMQLEVDWVGITPAQLQEYIIEHLYAEM